ncbi:MAG: hypothetical protein GXP19_08400 [Gammaproteobacteria bacterium]|nr:hypothetical protein [Gammaproteobacteria bacterium]
MKVLRHSVIGVLCSAGLFISNAMVMSSAMAYGLNYYDVTITNLTRGEIFTPVMVATHKATEKMFTLGTAPSDALAAMAEGGDTGFLSASLMTDHSESSGVLLLEGESVTVRVSADSGSRYISVAAMLIPTNDAFIAVNAVKLPRGRRALTIMSPVYDAGSEPNDEMCVNMPGPDCGGIGGSPGEDGEGYVHIHAGIHGIGDLEAADYDWRNPAAKIVIQRVKD